MPKEIIITIENRLILEEREMNIYHHATKGAHMISHDSSIKLPLRLGHENDYLHLSVVSGPGKLKYRSRIELPAWADFEFSSQGNVSVVHSGNRILVKIPPGPPDWQLKVTQSKENPPANVPSDHVTVGDD